MKHILFNGNMIEEGNSINVEDRGYQFGDGIYEVIGIYNADLFLMDEHLQRLERSAKEISLELPFTISEMKEQLIDLLKMNGVDEGLLYLQVSRGVASRDHQFPSADVSPVMIAYTKPLGDLTELQNKGSTAILTEDIRWLRCDIKTLNLLPNVLAKQKAVEHNAIEAIFHRGDTITEASSSNVFIVKSGELFTHPANNLILNGITRQKVIELCKELDLKVNEEAFTVETLLQADEVFITATKTDVVPLTEIDNTIIGNGLPGQITLKLLETFRTLTNSVTTR